MKKSDLKPGMVVQCENGVKRLVMVTKSGEIFFSGMVGGAYTHTSYINEDLTNKSSKSHDVIKVGWPKIGSVSFIFKKDNITWLWERILTIEIDAKVNGKAVPLSSISEETLLEIRRNSK